MSEIKVNKISPATGTEITLGDTSDKFIVPSGAELEVASGATITNAGTATNFGGGGAWIKLASTTISSATAAVDFTGCFSSTYKVYKVFITELTQTNTSGGEKCLQLLVGSTAQNDSNAYKTRMHWNSNLSATADTMWHGAREDEEGFRLNGNQGYSSQIPSSLSGEITIYNPNSNTNYTTFVSSVWQRTAPGGPYRQNHNNSGEYDSLVSATGLRFRLHNDDDVHAGTIDIYGLTTGA